MQVIRPVQIGISQLVSTTATELYSNWSAATTYTEGQRVIYKEKVWQSLQSSNINNLPDESFLFWLDIAPSNRTAMFDNQVSTQTIANSPFVFEVKPGNSFNSIALLNVQAVNINVKLYDDISGNLVYEQDFNLDDTQIADWYAYFYEEYDLRNDIVISGLPPYRSGSVRVTVTGGDTVKVGSFVVGDLIEIGQVQYGLNYGIKDYSIKETDEFGTTTFVERNFSKTMEPSVFVVNGRLNYISKLLTRLRATPTVWVASDDPRFTGTIIYGYYRDWNIQVSYPDHSLISLEIEGLS